MQRLPRFLIHKKALAKEAEFLGVERQPEIKRNPLPCIGGGSLFISGNEITLPPSLPLGSVLLIGVRSVEDELLRRFVVALQTIRKGVARYERHFRLFPSTVEAQKRLRIPLVTGKVLFSKRVFPACLEARGEFLRQVSVMLWH